MKRYSMIVAATLALAFLCACGANQRPDVVVAQTTKSIVDAATDLQHEVNRLTEAKAIPLTASDALAKASQTVYDKSGQVSDALKAYHAAATLTDRTQQASKVQTLLAQLDGPIADALNVKLPEGVGANLSKLVGVVMQAVAAIQAEVAKGLGGQQALPAAA